MKRFFLSALVFFNGCFDSRQGICLLRLNCRFNVFELPVHSVCTVGLLRLYGQFKGFELTVYFH